MKTIESTDTPIHPSAHHENPQWVRRESQKDVGELLDRYRNYLKLLARLRLGQRLRTKVDDSDLAQETLLTAWRSFEAFRGQSEAELMQWLRRILASTTADTLRRHHAAKRNLALEQRLEQELNKSSQLLDESLMAKDDSPSQQVLKGERARVLADAIAELPPEYGEVIVLHHLEGLTLKQIGQQMGRSSNGIQKLWTRALVQLHRSLRDLA